MTQFHWALVCVLMLLPGATSANSLSVSEQAAQTQRGLSSDEKQRRQQGCKWTKTTGSKRVSPAPGVRGHLVTLDDVQVLKIQEIKRSKRGENGFSINAYALLPNGGIAGMDICAATSVSTFENPNKVGSVILVSGVVLRTGVDVARDYPSTSRAIKKGGHLARSDGGAYVVFNLSQSKVKSWWSTQGATWNARRPGAFAFTIDDRLFYPVNVK